MVSVDSGPLRRNGPAQIRVTVFASSDYASERLDLFEASGAQEPVYWQYLGSVTPSVAGEQVLSFDYTPTDGPLTRVVRAAYRKSYALAQSSCSYDIFDDQDDLWFRIDSYPGAHALAVDGTSIDGAIGNVDVSYPGGGSAGACWFGPGGPRSCELELPDGANVTLTAMPDPGTAFAGWSGACSGTAPCVLSMTQAHQVSARFESSARPFTVVADGVNGAHGMVDAVATGWPGITCMYPGAGPGPVTCEQTYPLGTLVQLYASPAPDSVFVGWSGDCTGAQPYCQVTVSGPLTVHAQFDGPRPFTVVADGVNGAHGMVDAVATGWPGITCMYPGAGPGPVTCEQTYPLGTPVQLYASPAPDSVFVGWSGACAGAQPYCQVTVAGPLTVHAQFDGPRKLTVVVDGVDGAQGMVDAVASGWPGISCLYPGGLPGPVTCEGTYPLGTVVQVNAGPAPGSAFIGWAGACSGAAPTCEIVIDGNKTATGTFSGPGEAVAWTRATGVSVAGNTVTKTAAVGWDNGGASSTRALAEGSDGTQSSPCRPRPGSPCSASATATATWATPTSTTPSTPTRPTGQLLIFEGGTYRGQLGATPQATSCGSRSSPARSRTGARASPVYTSWLAPDVPAPRGHVVLLDWRHGAGGHARRHARRRPAPHAT